MLKLSTVLQLITISALSLFAMTAMPTQASNIELKQKMTPPPAGSFYPAGNLGIAVESIGRSQFADVYSGMSLTNHGTQVVIHLTKLDPQTKKSIIDSAPSNHFKFVSSPHTEKQMQDLHQKVTDLSVVLRSNGIDMVTWGPDVHTGKETIEVENLTPEQENDLYSEFGSENIEVSNTTTRPMLFDNRSSDSAADYQWSRR